MSKSFISIPVKTELFLELSSFLKSEGFSHDPVEIVEHAILYWMENVSWKKDDMYPGVSQSERGYSWKNVFMPHGTKIRMKYKGVMHYGAINGDELFYQDISISPSEFANKVAGGSMRNAWRDLEIKRPSDDEWFSANLLRTKLSPFDADMIAAEMDALVKNKASSKEI